MPHKNLAVYHERLGDKQHESIISYWKDHKIKIIIRINAFDIGINSSDVYLVIHYMTLLNISK